jgi:hypothetical protein
MACAALTSPGVTAGKEAAFCACATAAYPAVAASVAPTKVKPTDDLADAVCLDTTALDCGLGASHVRRLAIDAALLASIWLRSGELDQACTVARQAVEYTARTSSGRCRQRVTALLADLSGYRLSPCVTELTQFVHDVLPEAAGVS